MSQNFDASLQEAKTEQAGIEDAPPSKVQLPEVGKVSPSMITSPMQSPQHGRAIPTPCTDGESMTIIPALTSLDDSLLHLHSAQKLSVADEPQPPHHVTTTLEEPDCHSSDPLSCRTSTSTVVITCERQVGSLPEFEELLDSREIATPLNVTMASYQPSAKTPSLLISNMSREAVHQSNHLNSQGQKRPWEGIGDITNTIGRLEPQKRSRVPATGEVSQVSSDTESPSYHSSSLQAPKQKPGWREVKDSQDFLEPGFWQQRRESIENRTTQGERWNFGCRTWSAEDVLFALQTGREEAQGSGDITPPSSPLKTSTPLPVFQRTYNFGRPQSRPPTGEREPLANITDHYVPDFLQAPQPQISIEASPPTPGDWTEIPDDMQFETLVDEDVPLTSPESAKELQPATDAQGSSKNATIPSLSTEEHDTETTQGSISDMQPVANHLLGGLKSDATFMKDSLKQIKALKAKVQAHERRRDSVKEWLDLNTLVNTQSQKEKRELMIARYLQEAKAYDDAAERAEAESKEYRMKAKQLLDNARLEVELLLGDGATHAGKMAEEETDCVE